MSQENKYILSSITLCAAAFRVRAAFVDSDDIVTVLTCDDGYSCCAAPVIAQPKLKVTIFKPSSANAQRGATSARRLFYIGEHHDGVDGSWRHGALAGACFRVSRESRAVGMR